MSYEIIGETIKSAISIKLGELFKVATNQTDQQGNVIYTYPIRYKENITTQQYPNFHIVQVSCNMTPLQTKIQGAFNKDLKRIKLEYLMNIQYRVAKDTETITNLRQRLDSIGLKLVSEFTEIQLDYPVYTRNCRYEIADGILQFFCNIILYATNDQVDEVEMETLDLEEHIEGEE